MLIPFIVITEQNKIVGFENVSRMAEKTKKLRTNAVRIENNSIILNKKKP